jgi:hypothetical protein
MGVRPPPSAPLESTIQTDHIAAEKSKTRAVVLAQSPARYPGAVRRVRVRSQQAPRPQTRARALRYAGQSRRKPVPDLRGRGQWFAVAKFAVLLFCRVQKGKAYWGWLLTKTELHTRHTSLCVREIKLVEQGASASGSRRPGNEMAPREKTDVSHG